MFFTWRTLICPMFYMRVRGPGSFLEQDPVLPSAREVIHVWYIIFRDIVNIFYTGWSDCQINAISHV